jgi:hypothetical protein
VKLGLKSFFRGPDYQKQAEAESKKWGGHLAVEASGAMNAWLAAAPAPAASPSGRPAAAATSKAWT